MKFRYMEEQRGSHSVEMMAGVLEVSRGGYYAWRSRGRSDRSRYDERLLDQIALIQGESKYRYGSPRVTVALARRGYGVGHNRVARLMRENALGVRRRRRFRSTTDSNHSLSVAENLLNREFDVAEANRVWVSDLSYIATAEGWLYLCIIIDLYSRKVVGWSMSTRMKSDLVMHAFMMACMRRKPPSGVIFHSDRGSQYCSDAFGGQIKRYRFRQSMSRKGDPWDNAVAESFLKTLKSELCGHSAFKRRKEARTAIFEYIEVFYNRMRLHSTLGYLSPVEYERIGGLRAA